jgi:flagellar hook protein FlgE
MNHQVRMDVLGNNIANVNTIGFKGRRTTFEESFNQLMKGASRTDSKAGGTNPMQIGLGVNVGSVDVVMGQGGLSNTGRILDLAIEGNAFFGVSDGAGTYYTRNGAFQLDAEGYIMLPTNGMVLQGRMADTLGNFPPGTAIGNLQIPLNQQDPAKETTEIQLGRNLNSDGDAKGSIVYSQPMFHPADGARNSGADPTADPNAAGPNNPNDPGRTETRLDSLYDSQGRSLNIKEGDILTITYYDNATINGANPATKYVFTFKVEQPTDDTYTPGDTGFTYNGPNTSQSTSANGITTTTISGSGTVWNLDDLILAYNVALAESSGGTFNPATPTTPPTVTGATTSVSLHPDGSGSLNIASDPADAFFYLGLTSSNPESNSRVNNAFHFNSYVGGDPSGNYQATPPRNTASTYPYEDYGGTNSLALLRPAEQFDILANLRDKNGRPLAPGLEDGDPMDVFGSLGKNSIEGTKSDALIFTSPTYDPNGNVDLTDPANIPLPTLLDDLINKIRNDFRLPAEYIDKDGVRIPSVGMKSTGNDGMPDGIPAGAIVIHGSKGTEFGVNGLQIRAQNFDSDQIAPTYFNGAMAFTTKRAAQDLGKADIPITVYDSTGAEHVLNVEFVHSGKNNEWEWRVKPSGKDEIIEGGTGKVIFGQDGTIASWLYDVGSQLVIDPRNGADNLYINLNVGGPGDFRGITQFEGASTVNLIGQDGYPTGSLKEISIDEYGLIEGAFSNGTTRAIAQIMMVDFANPGGLLDVSESVYTLSANSGDPIWGKPISQSSSKLKPGALEISNVDLSAEFTNMIVTQRGYQANSRVITVSDTMLEELVNLKR